ncbi:MAG: DHA2 family efflux MFS transporter permease subunit [Novosphingobium sp.]
MGRRENSKSIAVTVTQSYRVIALVVAFALFMQQLDATVLTIALPAMSRDLNVPATALSLALTSYLVALAIFIPASGRMADRFGSRSVFCAALVIFVTGSVACAQSTSISFLIASRFLQGLGGAMMMPVGRLVLLRTVPREDLVVALSWLVMPALVGPILGPPIGGLIVTYFDWRWIFYINVPIGILGLIFALAIIPEVRSEAPSQFDWIGFILSGLALACLVFGLELASHPVRPVVVVILLGGGAMLAAAYIRHARVIANPVLDLSLLKIPTFKLSVAAGSLTRITQGAQPFLLPLMFQLGFGLSAAATGMITMSSAIGAIAMKPMAPRIIQRFGYRNSLTVAGIAASLGYASCAFFRPGSSIAVMIAVLLASGFFMSFLFTGYNAIAFADVEKSRMSAATSFYATFQQLSLSFGICLAVAALGLADWLPGGAGENAELGSFSFAFLIVTAISAMAVFLNRQFTTDAGR